MALANSNASTAESAVLNGTLLDRYMPQSSDARVNGVRYTLIVILGSVLLTASAKLSIPFYPVPMTLQTLVVLCLGLVLGPTLGAASVLAYLAQGALGLPVFAGTPEKGIGLAYMLGATGGYLLGFVVAAFVVGFLAKHWRWDRSFLTTIAAMVIGNAVIYLFGLLWLGSVLGWDKPILAWGLTPFLLADIAKILVAAALLPTLWKLFKP